MTPAELTLYARQQYNAVNDTFFSDAEMYNYIYDAEMQLARESFCIRQAYSTSTVADQQEYAKPANSLSIKRITYNGRKLMKISDRDDDSLTLFNQTTTATGTPQYYFEWGSTISLRPVPSDIGTLKIFSYDMPQQVTNTSTLEVPARYHLDLADYILSRMAAKDKNFEAATTFHASWTEKLGKARRDERKLIRGDANTSVVDEESVPVTVIGAL